MDKYYPEGDRPIKGYRADLEPGYQAAKQQQKEQEAARRRDQLKDPEYRQRH
jgi:hypothetical protein